MEPSTRKVVTRSPSHTVRLLHLPHVQVEPVEADSSYERDFVHIAGIYPFIRSIKHQPFTLEIGGGRYTPDFLLTFEDGSQLTIEVKPAEFVEQNLEKLNLARDELASKGIAFQIVTEDMMNREKASDVALLIRRYVKSMIDPKDIEDVLALVNDHSQGIEIEKVRSQLKVTEEVIFYLIGHHRICLEKRLEIKANSILIPREEFIRKVSNEYQTYAVHFKCWIDHQMRDDDA